MKKAGLKVTTIGISLRTFRAIVNVCIGRKLIKGDTKEMFKGTGYNLMDSRKEDHFHNIRPFSKKLRPFSNSRTVFSNKALTFFPPS